MQRLKRRLLFGSAVAGAIAVGYYTYRTLFPREDEQKEVAPVVTFGDAEPPKELDVEGQETVVNKTAPCRAESPKGSACPVEKTPCRAESPKGSACPLVAAAISSDLPPFIRPLPIRRDVTDLVFQRKLQEPSPRKQCPAVVEEAAVQTKQASLRKKCSAASQPKEGAAYESTRVRYHAMLQQGHPRPPLCEACTTCEHEEPTNNASVPQLSSPIAMDQGTMATTTRCRLAACATASKPAAKVNKRKEKTEETEKKEEKGEVKQMTVEDALDYLEAVRAKYKDSPHVYNEFLTIMKDFKEGTLETNETVRRVKFLFRGEPQLLLGFNQFLPPEFRIKFAPPVGSAWQRAVLRGGEKKIRPSAHWTATAPAPAPELAWPAKDTHWQPRLLKELTGVGKVPVGVSSACDRVSVDLKKACDKVCVQQQSALAHLVSLDRRVCALEGKPSGELPCKPQSAAPQTVKAPAVEEEVKTVVEVPASKKVEVPFTAEEGQWDVLEDLLHKDTPLLQRLRAECTRRGLEHFRFRRTPGDYYDWTLEARRAYLGAATTNQLCKTVVMQNTRGGEIGNRNNSKYYAVIVQYTARLKREKMTRVIQQLRTPRLGKKKYNFRLVSGEASGELTGYGHNSVTPILMKTDIPILMSHKLLQMTTDDGKHPLRYFWLGGGEVDVKWYVNAQEFVDKFDVVVGDITYDAAPAETTEA